MPGRLRFTRLFGFPIRVDWSWLIAVVLFAAGFTHAYTHVWGPKGAGTVTYWVMGSVTALLLFASVLLHELSHSLMARAQGLPISGITLFIFGGVAEMTREPDSAKQEFLMAAAGPAMSGLLAALFYAGALVTRRLGVPLTVVAVLRALGFLNLLMIVFNVLPGFPLDGGRVLRAILWRVTRSLKRATYISTRIGIGLAFLMIAYGVVRVLGRDYSGLWMALIGFFLKEAAESGYQQVLLKRALAGVRVEQVMSTPLVTAPPDLPLDVLVDEYFLRHRYKSFPVVDSGRLVGLVSLAEVKAVPRDRWSQVTAGEVMATDVLGLCVSPGDDVGKALGIMVQHGLGRIPVCREGEPMGMITRRDIMEVFRIRTDLGEEARGGAADARTQDGFG